MIILIAIYVLSVLFIRRWTRIAYSENGCFFNLDTDLIDIVLTLTPVFNTIAVFAYICESPYKKGYHNPTNYNRFFSIKK